MVLQRAPLKLESLPHHFDTCTQLTWLIGAEISGMQLTATLSPIDTSFFLSQEIGASPRVEARPPLRAQSESDGLQVCMAQCLLPGIRGESRFLGIKPESFTMVSDHKLVTSNYFDMSLCFW